MSQVNDSVKPNVIDDEMVQKAMEEQCPEVIRNLGKREGVKDVTELQLSFRNILQIANLWQFENLTKLQLDNNIIEKIEALESLVHLVWLDLSFNNIEVIEGLDTLVNLQDLSLCRNRISKIEHMDTLQKLQIFSIGKNNLTALEDVVYLRRFKNLRTLNLTGNPLCDDERYMLFVVAHLPDLVYLDFKLVSENTVSISASPAREVRHRHPTSACFVGMPAILPAFGAGSLQKSGFQRHAMLALCVLLTLLRFSSKAAFVEYLNGSFLFDSLYAEDAEAAKLAYLPGVGDLLQAYPSWATEFVSVCENLFRYGLKEFEKREAEVSDFYKSLHEVLTASQQEARKITLDFENRNQRRLDEVRSATSSDLAESKRAEYREDVGQLSEALMTLEMRHADQLEELIKDFKGQIAVVASTFIEDVKGIYPLDTCRDLENHHHEQLLEICISTLEKSAKNELDEDLPEDIRMLLVDKNTIVNAVNASHRIRLLKIDKRESDILCNTYQW
ncbi:Leucine-rich repeat-containing protein 48, partial [Pterocles gutturalis]